MNSIKFVRSKMAPLSMWCCHRIIAVTAGVYTPKLAPAQVRLRLVSQYSTTQTRHNVGQGIVSKLKRANETYERFLQRHFPRFYVLYHAFKRGFRLLFQDVREVRRIKSGMLINNIDHQKLPYREMEKLRQFRRDMLKAIPLVIISAPPFANYLVFVLMYLFPRQLLIRHFWTPQQLVEFQGVYHAQRAHHHPELLSGLEKAAAGIKDVRLKTRLLELCSKVHSGAQPVVSDVHAVRTLFSGPPLGMRRMSTEQMSHLCPLLFLTSRLPAFWIGQRLNSHALELMQLDHAIVRLGLHQLNDMELKEACYVRGLNVQWLSPAQCLQWLSQWLQFSTHLKESETSLYLHSMMLLTVNYPKPPHS
ncbi:LETM1 domain-containing protein 1 isoform X2 [Electrophorus electricus]|uniref:LETM1 domain-containing protein 1 isoform X2 n=1 Tax=Electrophorus electricus TaxID=8005 RepID=UPI0015D06DC4|nr:LETM1 domain-containing protein 1 isoform X2 [Electrophorus electricus]